MRSAPLPRWSPQPPLQALALIACLSCGGDDAYDAQSACEHLSDCGQEVGTTEECVRGIQYLYGGSRAFVDCMYRCLSTVPCSEEDAYTCCVDDQAPGPKCEQILEDS